MFGLQAFSLATLGRVLAVGFVAGAVQLAVYWGFLWLSSKVESGQVEEYVPLVLIIISILFAHFLGLIGLIRLQILRPLLVILAVVATVWGVWNWVEAMPWWAELLSFGLLTGLAYAFYSWVNRLLSFPIALIVSIVAVIVARLIFISL